MHFRRVDITVLAILIFVACSALADGLLPIPPTEIYVKADGSGDLETIQEAIDAIADGGTIYLHDGIYQGDGNVNLIFPAKALNLQSISDNPETCIIDCEATPPPSSGSAGRGSNEGTRGGDSTVRAFFFSEPGDTAYIRGMRLLNGFAPDGGAVFIQNTSPTFENVDFRSNQAGSEGGAIWIKGSSAFFNNCHFENNHVDGYGAAIQVYGGIPGPTIQDSRFINITAQYSGAIDLYESAGIKISHSVFWGNYSSETGGAITDWDAGTTVISSSTFAENEATEGGHIYFGANFKVQLNSNVFAFAPRGGSFRSEMRQDRETVTFSCCNVSGNTDGDWSGEFAIYEGVDGNFSADPQFCGEIGSGNFLLETDSPCAPAENSCGEQIGAFPVGCEDTVAAGSSWSQLKRIY